MIPERDGVKAFPQKQLPASFLPASFSLPFSLIHVVSFPDFLFYSLNEKFLICS